MALINRDRERNCTAPALSTPNARRVLGVDTKTPVADSFVTTLKPMAAASSSIPGSFARWDASATTTPNL